MENGIKKRIYYVYDWSASSRSVACTLQSVVM